LNYRGSVGEIGGGWWSTLVFGVGTKGNGSISPAERGNMSCPKSFFAVEELCTTKEISVSNYYPEPRLRLKVPVKITTLMRRCKMTGKEICSLK
jgi:hypothetical protein